MRYFLIIVTLLAFSVVSFSQIKSIETARNEIKAFSGASAYSINYDEARYQTIVELRFEILKEKDNLSKTFSKFEWQVTSYFAIEGIDSKAVRNTLCIKTQSKTFQFSRENELILKFPNGEVKFGPANRSSELKRGKAIETLCWDFNNEIIEDFADSSQLEYGLGVVSSNLSQANLLLFRDFSLLLKIAPAK